MPTPEVIGRYAIHGAIAAGGMATVHLGRLLGSAGFSRTVAIKRMHPQLVGDPEFVAMFLDEARLAARIRHPNVVSTLDVVTAHGELFLVLDYVQGETLAGVRRRLTASGGQVPVPIAVAVLSGVLRGLHAAHEATNERGEPLGLVHRDVSPQNIIVGVDGIPRVLDFGVAKAVGRLQTTRTGTLKGKVPYMAREQLLGGEVTRRSDVYSAAVVLWETLVGRRLFVGDNDAATLHRVLHTEVPAPRALRPDVPGSLDAVVLRGLCPDPNDRFATAEEMATALEASAEVAIAPVVGAWVREVAADSIATQSSRLEEVEQAPEPPPSPETAVTAVAEDAPTLEAPTYVATPAPPALDEAVRPVSQLSAPSVVAAPWTRPTGAAWRGVAAVVVPALIVGIVAIYAMRHHPPAGATQAAPSSEGRPVDAIAPAASDWVPVGTASREPVGLEAGVRLAPAAPAAAITLEPSGRKPVTKPERDAGPRSTSAPPTAAAKRQAPPTSPSGVARAQHGYDPLDHM